MVEVGGPGILGSMVGLELELEGWLRRGRLVGVGDTLHSRGEGILYELGVV